MPSMKTLTDYLADTGMTQSRFAVDVGVDQATISKLCRGRMIPSLELAVRISAKTGGQVIPQVWVREGIANEDTAA